jgi:hypothetical protein
MIIRKLDLQSNSIGVLGARDLSSALKANRTLTTLDVSNNALGPEGFAFVCFLYFRVLKMTQLKVVSQFWRL